MPFSGLRWHNFVCGKIRSTDVIIVQTCSYCSLLETIGIVPVADVPSNMN